MAARPVNRGGRLLIRDQRRLPDWLPQLVTPAAALLGFLVYATTRGGFEAFFQSFNVNLDEVGLSQASIVGRAGVHLASLLVLLIGVAALAFVIERIFTRLLVPLAGILMTYPGSPLRRFLVTSFPQETLRAALRSLLDRLSKVWRSIKRALVWLLDELLLAESLTEEEKEIEERHFERVTRELTGSTLVALSGRVLIRSFFRGFIRFGIGAFGLALVRTPHLWFLLLFFLDLIILSASGLWRFPEHAFRLWLIVVGSVVISLVVVHSALLAEGQRDAQCAMAQETNQSPLLGITTELVTIQWTDPSLSPDFPKQDRFLFLGSGKMLVLYDLNIKKSVRVPPEKVVLSGLLEGPTHVCPTNFASK